MDRNPGLASIISDYFHVNYIVRATPGILIHGIVNTLDFFWIWALHGYSRGAGRTSHTYGIINTWTSANFGKFYKFYPW